MEHIQGYELFEASNLKHQGFSDVYSSYSSQDYLNTRGRPLKPGVSGMVHNFFKGMEKKFDNFGKSYAQHVEFKPSANNWGTNAAATGVGDAIGIAGSLVSGVLSKIFDPKSFFRKSSSYSTGSSKYSGTGTNRGTDRNLPIPKTEKDVTLQHKNLFLDEYETSTLPRIKTKSQLEKYIAEYYKKAGVKPGEVNTVDQLAAHQVAMFMNKSI